jgi:acetyl-CoA carboxylase carboxyl transferase subunit alpha
MKLTAKDLLKLGVIDEIITEPLGGAHRDPESIAADIKNSLIKNLKSFENLNKEEIYDHRKAKFLQIGRGQGFSKSTSLQSGGLSYKEANILKLVSRIGKNKLIYAGIALLAITALIVLIF